MDKTLNINRVCCNDNVQKQKLILLILRVAVKAMKVVMSIIHAQVWQTSK